MNCYKSFKYLKQFKVLFLVALLFAIQMIGFILAKKQKQKQNPGVGVS